MKVELVQTENDDPEITLKLTLKRSVWQTLIDAMHSASNIVSPARMDNEYADKLEDVRDLLQHVGAIEFDSGVHRWGNGTRGYPECPEPDTPRRRRSR